MALHYVHGQFIASSQFVWINIVFFSLLRASAMLWLLHCSMPDNLDYKTMK